MAIAGHDFAVIGSDTRITSVGNYPSLRWSKIFQLTDNKHLVPSDVGLMLIRSEEPFHGIRINKAMSISSLAELLSSVLYVKCLCSLPYWT